MREKKKDTEWYSPVYLFPNVGKKVTQNDTAKNIPLRMANSSSDGIMKKDTEW